MREKSNHIKHFSFLCMYQSHFWRLYHTAKRNVEYYFLTLCKKSDPIAYINPTQILQRVSTIEALQKMYRSNQKSDHRVSLRMKLHSVYLKNGKYAVGVSRPWSACIAHIFCKISFSASSYMCKTSFPPYPYMWRCHHHISIPSHKFVSLRIHMFIVGDFSHTTN